VNRTRVLLDHRRLVVTEGPIPARGAIDEPIANVERFGVRLCRRSGGPVMLRLRLGSFDEADWLCRRWNHALDEAQRPPMPATYRG
jgi:hypothetical protein